MSHVDIPPVIATVIRIEWGFLSEPYRTLAQLQENYGMTVDDGAENKRFAVNEFQPRHKALRSENCFPFHIQPKRFDEFLHMLGGLSTEMAQLHEPSLDITLKVQFYNSDELLNFLNLINDRISQPIDLHLIDTLPEEQSPEEKLTLEILSQKFSKIFKNIFYQKPTVTPTHSFEGLPPTRNPPPIREISMDALNDGYYPFYKVLEAPDEVKKQVEEKISLSSIQAINNSTSPCTLSRENLHLYHILDIDKKFIELLKKDQNLLEALIQDGKFGETLKEKPEIQKIFHEKISSLLNMQKSLYKKSINIAAEIHFMRMFAISLLSTAASAAIILPWEIVKNWFIRLVLHFPLNPYFTIFASIFLISMITYLIAISICHQMDSQQQAKEQLKNLKIPVYPWLKEEEISERLNVSPQPLCLQRNASEDYKYGQELLIEPQTTCHTQKIKNFFTRKHLKALLNGDLMEIEPHIQYLRMMMFSTMFTAISASIILTETQLSMNTYLIIFSSIFVFSAIAFLLGVGFYHAPKEGPVLQV